MPLSVKCNIYIVIEIGNGNYGLYYICTAGLPIYTLYEYSLVVTVYIYTVIQKKQDSDAPHSCTSQY